MRGIKLKKITTLLIFLLFFVTPLLFSQNTDIDKIKSQLPKMLGASNEGYDFWFSIPPSTVGGTDEYIRFLITSDYESQINLTIPAKGYSDQKKVMPNQVIEFRLLSGTAQPFAHVDGKPKVEDVYKGYGINIKSDKPILVYCIVNFYRSADGFLGLPVNTLGKNYIVTSYNDLGDSQYPSEVCIVAAYDNTSVKFTMGGTNSSKTAGGLTPGQSISKYLNKGDVFVFQSKGKGSDLTGSIIESNKPVSVLSGNVCANVPATISRCDYLVEMNFPTFTWGKIYPISKIAKRQKPSIIRIFSREPSTVISRDGITIGSLPAYGGVQSQGYLELRMIPVSQTPRSTTITSDKPVAICLYNTGNNDDGTVVQSDPFIMNQLPYEQFYNEFTFMTTGITGQEFAEYFINLIYPVNESGVMPDDLEIADLFIDVNGYSKLKNKYSYTEDLFPDSIDGKKYAARQFRLDGEGLYRIRANGKIAGYTYGTDANESYGQPAKAYLKNLDRDDNEPPSPTWTGNPNLSNITGRVIDMPNDQNRRSNMALVIFHQDLSYNYTFKCNEFFAGEDRMVDWTLKAIDANKDARASITFIDRNGNDSSVIIDYFSGNISISPAKSEFDDLRHGETITKSVWAVNKSALTARTVTKLQLKKGDQGFAIQNISLPFEIPKSDSVELKIKFTASEVSGIYSDSIGIGDNNAFSYQGFVSVKVGEPKIEVSDFDFGQRTVGSINKMNINIANTGTTKLIITGAMSNLQSVFNYNFGITPDNPLVLLPGEINNNLIINFKPNDRINFLDTLIFLSNTAIEGDSILVMKGSGIKPLIEVEDVNFQDVILGGKYTKDITISNLGEDPLVITGFEHASSSDFKLIIKDDLSVENPITIAPTEKLTTQIEYEPKEESKSGITDNISFESNSMAGGDNNIKITVKSVINEIIDNTEKPSEYIYPNPVSDVLYVRNSNSSLLSWEIMEQSGRKVIDGICNDNSSAIKIKIVSLASGVYFIKLRYDDKVVMERFSVVK